MSVSPQLIKQAQELTTLCAFSKPFDINDLVVALQHHLSANTNAAVR
jgi:hypothetical protein